MNQLSKIAIFSLGLFLGVANSYGSDTLRVLVTTKIYLNQNDDRTATALTKIVNIADKIKRLTEFSYPRITDTPSRLKPISPAPKS